MMKIINAFPCFFSDNNRIINSVQSAIIISRSVFAIIIGNGKRKRGKCESNSPSNILCEGNGHFALLHTTLFGDTVISGHTEHDIFCLKTTKVALWEAKVTKLLMKLNKN